MRQSAAWSSESQAAFLWLHKIDPVCSHCSRSTDFRCSMFEQHDDFKQLYAGIPHVTRINFFNLFHLLRLLWKSLGMYAFTFVSIAYFLCCFHISPHLCRKIKVLNNSFLRRGFCDRSSWKNWFSCKRPISQDLELSRGKKPRSSVLFFVETANSARRREVL